MKHQVHTTIKTTLGDLTTPVAAFLRIRDHFSDAALFESADFQGGKQEFSYICFDTLCQFQLDRRAATISVSGSPDISLSFDQLADQKKDVVASLFQKVLDLFETTDRLPEGILNGFFGFTSYDAIEYCEDLRLSSQPEPEEEVPLLYYRLYRYILAFDHQDQELHVIQNSLGRQAADDSRKILALATTATYHAGNFKLSGESSSAMTDLQHEALIGKCKEHILRGDVFQIVPSRKFRQPFQGDDFQVYRALRKINPSPYLFYFKGDGFTLIGSSPEAQIEIKGKQARISPIAGTYPRTGNDTGDQEAARSLLADPKEVSEHVMLVDLARNDLSTYCYPVEVERFKFIEFYSHVIHLVSKVVGTLMSGSNPARVFAATSPAGTLTGAPKYKAMQLLDAYEPSRRHYYGGSIGLVALNGDILHAIMIRTFLSKNQTLYSQAGSGIVFDSEPHKEVAEVKNKLAALRAAAQLAEKLQ